MEALAKRIIEKDESLRAARATWDNTCQECLDYIVPRKANITTTRTPGDKQNPDIYDSTAIDANERLAAALHGTLTNPTTPFLELTTGIDELDSDDDVKQWLQEEATGIQNDLNGSNFQTEVHEVYIDLGAIGTSCFAIEEDDAAVVRFSTRPFGEYSIDENNKGEIDTVYRAYKWKPRQIVQEFGIKNVGEHVQKLYQKGSNEPLDIIHAVEPRDVASAGRNPKNFSFSSLYVLKEKAFVLRESGFREFPYAAPRWTKIAGEIYGRSCGMKMLADIKMLNEMMYATITGAHLSIRPPTAVEDDGVMGPVRLTPGGLTIIRSGSQPPKPIILNPKIDFGYQCIADCRNQIRSGFYTDQIQLQQGPQKTATEVLRINDDQLRFMGPILGRQYNEFLRPVVERTYAIRVRKGRVKPAPEKLRNVQIKVKYSSLIARAQRITEGQNFARAMNAAAPIMQLDQSAARVINAVQSVRHLWDVYGAPQKTLRTNKELEQIQQAENTAKQELIRQQTEAQKADQIAKVGPTLVQAQQVQQ